MLRDPKQLLASAQCPYPRTKVMSLFSFTKLLDLNARSTPPFGKAKGISRWLLQTPLTTFNLLPDLAWWTVLKIISSKIDPNRDTKTSFYQKGYTAGIPQKQHETTSENLVTYLDLWYQNDMERGENRCSSLYQSHKNRYPPLWHVPVTKNKQCPRAS